MRYELYGVFSDSGRNVFISAHRSMKKAFEAVPRLNPNTHPMFIILEKPRKGTSPIGCESGFTYQGHANRSCSFVTGVDPTRSMFGRKYWAGTSINDLNKLAAPK